MSKKENDSTKYEYEGVVAKKKARGYGTRHTQVILLFLSVCCVCFVRGCLSVAILGMTDGTLHNATVQTFDWPKSIQGVIFSSPSWGDLAATPAAGYLVCKYGGKRFITLTAVLGGALSLLTPLSAYLGGWKGVCFTRMCCGFFQSFIFPSIQNLLGKWVPVSERCRLGIFVYLGVSTSAILVTPISAYIAASSLAWPWIFYFFGGLSIINGLFWAWYGSNSPAEHKTISPEERNFIQKSLGHENIVANASKHIPWREILTSAPVLALIVSQVGAFFGYSIMLMEIPTYFKLALGIELQNTGLLAALPNFANLVVSMSVGFVADHLLNSGLLSATAIRKLANTLGTFGPAAALMALVYVPVGNVTTAVVFVVVILGCDAFSAAGFMLNHLDLSTNYAAIIASVSLSISNIGSVAAPLLTGFILKDPTDITQWRTVFMMTAGSYFFGNVLYLIYGSGDEQPWNIIKDKGENSKKAEEDYDVIPLKNKGSA